MIQDYIDMDTQEKIRYISESSNASTSGYSTMSSGMGGPVGNQSPTSSQFSTPPSPAQSPATMLKADFSNLRCNSPPSQQQQHQQQQQTHSPQFAPLQTTSMPYGAHNFMNLTSGSTILPQHHLGMQPMFTQASSSAMHVKKEYLAKLRILEYPVEKFRFRYKSEMHGTHGSLNGANSKRIPKTFPEVELCNYNGRAVIRCSLFQTNLESPHSHQLVVRKDESDICDPHDLHVSPERGYVAQFQNMGIIHTAKKFILEELLKKKKDRLRFELGRDELSTKQIQELYKETEKEAKDMNLNQVRLCFEAFKVEDSGLWTRIAAPAFSNAINNRKSAQTGELRICRLSIVTGSVVGGDDLILLVEKVSKKNIKVRFYELNEDDETTWEAFGKFRESDVHHQYAIVCQTPPYKDKETDKPVEVCIELVRPSDDERSFPPVTFRYKPRDAIASRKRRRTCSTATNSSGSLSSFELPKTVQEQTGNVAAGGHMGMGAHAPTISEEYNKDHELQKLIESDMFRTCINSNSEELTKLCPQNLSDFYTFDDLMPPPGFAPSAGRLEGDGAVSAELPAQHSENSDKKKLFLQRTLSSVAVTDNPHLTRIFKIYEEAIQVSKVLSETQITNAATLVADIFIDHADKHPEGDTLIHEIIANDNHKLGIKICHVISFFKLNDLLSRALNTNGESGLHCACLHDRPHFIRPLLGLGCNPSIQDRHGNTALHVAVKEQHTKCIDSFLNMDGLRLNLTIRNDGGLTALHLAIRTNNDDAAAKLLQHDPSAALQCNTKDGNNALHMAVLQQNLNHIKLIFTAKQSMRDILSTRNAAGHTAIDLAKGLDPKTGADILNYLSSLCTDSDAALVIKEEEISSSSTEDDEDNNEPMSEMIIIKEEFLDNDDSSPDLVAVLNNEQTFQKLAELLTVSNKWKRLAEELKMQHLLCLWISAGDLLTYLKRKSDSVNYETFVNALLVVGVDLVKGP